MGYDDLKIISGNSNRKLADAVAKFLHTKPAEVTVKNFSDGETFVRIEENIRGADVFIVQSTCQPANDNLMELLVTMDALKRASADRITAVMPYYGYARQDRKDSPRTPITARLVADLLQSAGADRVFSLDLHAAQIQGFFDIPVDHLFAAPVLLEFIKEKASVPLEELVLVSPDAGGVERARAFGKRLNCNIAVADKRRDAPGSIAEINIIGDVKGKEAIIIDDMVDTAGTMCMVAQGLKEQGATKVWAVCTHGVLSGPAINRVNESCLERLLVTDTIPMERKVQECSKLEVLSVADLLGEAILRIHKSDSVSSLFV
jgi:ribose-phosphate pyrophosphokinase